jgi:hypothetical protein
LAMQRVEGSPTQRGTLQAPVCLNALGNPQRGQAGQHTKGHTASRQNTSCSTQASCQQTSKPSRKGGGVSPVGGWDPTCCHDRQVERTAPGCYCRAACNAVCPLSSHLETPTHPTTLAESRGGPAAAVKAPTEARPSNAAPALLITHPPHPIMLAGSLDGPAPAVDDGDQTPQDRSSEPGRHAAIRTHAKQTWLAHTAHHSTPKTALSMLAGSKPIQC